VNEEMTPQTLNEYLFDCIVNDAEVWGWLCDNYQCCTPQPFYDKLKTALRKYRRQARNSGQFDDVFDRRDQEQRWLPLIFELTKRLEEITASQPALPMKKQPEKPMKHRPSELLPKTTDGLTFEEKLAWWEACKRCGVPYVEKRDDDNSDWDRSGYYPNKRPTHPDVYRIPIGFGAIWGFEEVTNAATQPETIEGDETMKSFTIENRIYVNGNNIDTMTDDELLTYVTSAEAEMERLQKIKTTSAKVKDRIEELAKFCVDTVAIIDAR